MIEIEYSVPFSQKCKFKSMKEDENGQIVDTLHSSCKLAKSHDKRTWRNLYIYEELVIRTGEINISHICAKIKMSYFFISVSH